MWVVDLVDQKDHVLDGSQDPHVKGNFEGKGAAHYKV